MPFEERKAIIENLSSVDSVIDFDDDDSGSATNALIKVKEIYPSDDIAFANGGDRATSEVPESFVCSKYNIEMVDGLGDKIRSSSTLTGLKQLK